MTIIEIFYSFGMFVWSVAIIYFCYVFSKELYHFIFLRLNGLRTEAIIIAKIRPLTGPGLRMIDFMFDVPSLTKIKVRQRVTVKTYNILKIGQSINILYMRELPKIARITDVPKERAYLGNYSLFFIVLVIGFYPIILLPVLFVSVEAVHFILSRSKVTIDDDYFK